MNFDPKNFFIGLMDFFSILMPGALVAYLLKGWAADLALPVAMPSSGAEAMLVFLFASYLLGHFVFLVGSLLDDLVYDPLRSCTDRGQMWRLAKGKALLPRWPRRAVRMKWLFGKNPDTAVVIAERSKARALHVLEAESAINAFQWSKARLSRENPEGLAAVQRFEADSKFFRSFVVVLAAFTLICFFRGNRAGMIVCALLLVPALWRYVEQRFKATQQAYWNVITLDGVAASAPARPPRPDGVTHAGGVVYREREGKKREYLLVQVSGDRTQWVLPKGHIEPGEAPRETAVREVREEAGHWARVIQWMEDTRFEKDSGFSLVCIYLMELKEEGRNEWLFPEEHRERVWLPLGEAKERTTFRETRELLEKAGRALLKKEDSREPDHSSLETR